MRLATYIIALLIFLTPASAYAEWYWLTIPEDPTIGEFTELSAVEYAVTSIPKDQLQTLPDTFMDTLSSTTDSAKCSGEYDNAVKELREFDATHELYTTIGYKATTDIVLNQATVDSRASLITNIERGAMSCLKAEQNELEEQAKKEAEEKREAEVQQAVNDCDFDFFENEMTNEERMDTWDERQSCINVTTVEPPEDMPIVPEIKEEPVVVPVVTPTQPAPTQTSVPAPVFSPEPVLEEQTETVVEEVEATTTEVVSTEPQPEPEEVTEAETVAEPTPKSPSFLKRIANFFNKLFSW